MAFELPQLPFDPSALDPHISARTFEFHHGKHHNAYVGNLNKLISGTDLAEKGLEEIILAVAGDASKAGLFNNAAQVWNHTFFWNSMKPSGGGAPSGDLAARIDADFGSFDDFKAAFKAAAVGRFGRRRRRFGRVCRWQGYPPGRRDAAVSVRDRRRPASGWIRRSIRRG